MLNSKCPLSLLQHCVRCHNSCFMQLGMALLVLIHACVAALYESCVRCFSNTWIGHLLSGAYVRAIQDLL